MTSEETKSLLLSLRGMERAMERTAKAMENIHGVLVLSGILAAVAVLVYG